MEGIVFPTPAVVYVCPDGLMFSSGGPHKVDSFVNIKTHTFNGRKYKIDISSIDGPLDGQCDVYKCNERHLQIFTELNTRRGLITAIHESLHAENWAASEEVVDRVSKEIGSFLWRLGYRNK